MRFGEKAIETEAKVGGDPLLTVHKEGICIRERLEHKGPELVVNKHISPVRIEKRTAKAQT